jgi:SAM-dependent methyltransferase
MRRKGMSSIDDFLDAYARIFSLCELLEIANLYDIGCSNGNQAAILADYSDMFYTGIDCDNRIDFTHINKLYGKERITFQKGLYPFAITPAENNIAISCYSLGTMWTDEKSIKNITEALSRDFERIIMNISNYKINIWEAGLKVFQLQELSYNHQLIFGTKFEKDISILEKIGYDYLDGWFTLGLDCSEFFRKYEFK